MQIVSNAPAFRVWTNYAANLEKLSQSMIKLSTGLAISTAADDPSGLAISQRLLQQSNNSSAAGQNIQNGLSYTQTADSWLQQVQNILGNMSDLAVSAADTTKTTADIASLQTQFAQMQTELSDISSNTTYNTKLIFNQGNITLRVGADSSQTFTITGMALTSALSTAATSGGGSGALTDSLQTTTLTAVSADVSAASDAVSSIRATLGAQGSRLQNVLAGVTSYEANLRSAESQIRDVDMAREASNFAKYQTAVQVGSFMLAQVNAMPQNVLMLLQ